MNSIIPLSETDSYVLFSEHEDIFLFDKDLNKEIWRTSMHGNVTCGLLSVTHDWAIAGGEHLLIWFDNKLQEIGDSDLQWVHDIRQTNDFEVEVLIDPWSEKPAIWNLDLRTLKKTKVRDFNEYVEKPFQDTVNW